MSLGRDRDDASGPSAEPLQTTPAPASASTSDTPNRNSTSTPPPPTQNSLPLQYSREDLTLGTSARLLQPPQRSSANSRGYSSALTPRGSETGVTNTAAHDAPRGSITRFANSHDQHRAARRQTSLAGNHRHSELSPLGFSFVRSSAERRGSNSGTRSETGTNSSQLSLSLSTPGGFARGQGFFRSRESPEVAPAHGMDVGAGGTSSTSSSSTLLNRRSAASSNQQLSPSLNYFRDTRGSPLTEPPSHLETADTVAFVSELGASSAARSPMGFSPVRGGVDGGRHRAVSLMVQTLGDDDPALSFNSGLSPRDWPASRHSVNAPLIPFRTFNNYTGVDSSQMAISQRFPNNNMMQSVTLLDASLIGGNRSAVSDNSVKKHVDRRFSTAVREGEGVRFGDVTIPREEMASLKRTFEAFDEDHSNSIDVNELKLALAAAGHALTNEQLAELFEEVQETPPSSPRGSTTSSAAGSRKSSLQFLNKNSQNLRRASDAGGSTQAMVVVEDEAESVGKSLTFNQFVQLLLLWKEACQYKMFEGGNGMTVQDQRIRNSLQTRLITHDGIFRVVWDLLIYCVTFYIWCWTSFFLTRGTTTYQDFTERLLPWDVVVCVILALDIVVEFVSTRKGPTELLDDYKSVAVAYASSWLVLDLIAVLPYHQLAATEASFIFSLVRLIKMVKMPFLFQRSGRQHLTPLYLMFTVNIIPLFKKLYACLTIIHAVSVLWSILKQYDPESTLKDVNTPRPSDLPSYLQGDNNPDYTTAVYFVMATLSTCGYGDTVVDGPLQQMFALILCVGASLLNGIAIGLVVENIRQSDIYTERADKLRNTLGVCQYFHIPSSLLNEILSFQNHVLEHNLGAAYTYLIRGLPEDMRSNIGLFVRVSLISKVHFFMDAHKGVKVAIAQHLTPKIFLPEEYVFIAGEPGDSMYFISHGFTDVVTTDGILIRSLKTGDYVGENALLERDNIRRVSVKALTYCDLFTLTVEDFLLILVRFPKVRRRVASEAMKIFEGEGGITSEVEVVPDEQLVRAAKSIRSTAASSTGAASTVGIAHASTRHSGVTNVGTRVHSVSVVSSSFEASPVRRNISGFPSVTGSSRRAGTSPMHSLHPSFATGPVTPHSNATHRAAANTVDLANENIAVSFNIQNSLMESVASSPTSRRESTTINAGSSSTPMTELTPNNGKVISRFTSGVNPGLLFKTSSSPTLSSPSPNIASSISNDSSGRVPGSSRMASGRAFGSHHMTGNGGVVTSVSSSLPASEQLEYCKSMARSMRETLQRDTTAIIDNAVTVSRDVESE